ncbi:TPA: hypothetical protein N0F65_007384 [Lagenidium giganteum]|uniref:Uncharacterized protein n=1 Tax=Lagenidium giganteum TaxID=4803 RepID=A0AAV2YGA8_9STRA|nr:TPA: hypothetical protein N0F65_007384 [Lagenidium giganteum]
MDGFENLHLIARKQEGCRYRISWNGQIDDALCDRLLPCLQTQKELLVYRWTPQRSSCLLYLGYEGGRVEQFAIPECDKSQAGDVYYALCQQQGIRNVWLLLNGLRYNDIPEKLTTFEEDMKERFYYSGGSVREFTQPTTKEIRIRILNV